MRATAIDSPGSIPWASSQDPKRSGSTSGALSFPIPAQARGSGSAAGLERLDQLRHDLLHVADDAEVRDREDRGLTVLVHGDDVVGALHADHVLGRTGDAER